MKWITVNQYQTSERYYKLIKILLEDEQHKDMKLKVKVAYALLKTRLELWEDNPYFTNCLKGFFGNTGSPASPAQLFLSYWEGNSGDKLLEYKTRETEQYYQIEKGFCQPNGVTAQSDSNASESVRRELYDNSIPGGGDAMSSVLGEQQLGSSSQD